MDEVLQEALEAAGVAAHDVETWHALVAEAYAGSSDWDDFDARLRDGAGDDAVVDGFLAQLGERGGYDELERMSASFPADDSDDADDADDADDESADDSDDADDESHDAVDESADGSGHEADDEVWASLLPTYGVWDEWDGSQERWEQLRDWVYAELYGESEDWHRIAWERLSPLDELGADARLAELERLGVQVTSADEASHDEPHDATAAAADADADAPDAVDAIPVVEIHDEQVLEQIAEKVYEPAMAQLMESLPDIADQLGMSVDELRSHVAELPIEFFADLVADEVGAAS